MFEMLLYSGYSGKPFFPDSGPGSKYLKAGNADIGWFGLVTSAELFQGWEVSSALNLTAGSAFNENNTTWMKFVYYGKYLFVAQQPLRRNLSWNDVYSAGGIYGVRGPGTYPMPGNSVDQMRIMIKPEAGVEIPWKLAVRSMSGAAEPFNPADTNALRLATGNEHNDLIYRLIINGTGLPAMGTWEAWTGSVISPSTATATILKETSSTNTLNAEVRTATGTTLVGAKNAPQATDAAWRPVLELLKGDTYVFSPYAVYHEYLGNQGPASITSQFIDVVYAPTQVLSTEAGDAKVLNISTTSFVDVARSPSYPVVSNTITPVAMTFTRT